MIFSNLIKKPKWQHRDPNIRQMGIENLDDPTILNEVAQNDEAAEVRQAALHKINDLNVLDQIAQHDTDSRVRELAEQRLKQLLGGKKDDCPALDTRLTWVKKTTDAERLAYIAEHGSETELRLAAIEKVEREGLLGDIAINDPISEVRLAAVAKLTQKSTLERVFKTSRNRDKRVSRIARDKLDKVIEQKERPARVRAECEAICTKLESIERRLNSETSNQKRAQGGIDDSKVLKQENAEFKRLQERFSAIAADADNECQTCFTFGVAKVMAALSNSQQTLEAAQEREQARAPLRAAKKELCEQMEVLLIDLKNSQRLGREDEKTFDQRFNALQSQWAETQPLDEPEEEQQWQARFERASQSVQKRHQKLQAYSNVANQLEATCAQADILLNGTEALKSEQLKDLQARWQAYWEEVPKDKPHAVFSELNRRFDNTLKALQTRTAEQKEQRKQAVHELKQLLKDLEAALERGELKTAIPLEQKARQLQSSIVDLDKTPERRLQACTAQIKELQGWQRWGNKLEREKLCEQVESLLETEDDNPSELARLTEEAQTAWKRLGSSGYSPEFWERFNQACQRAYRGYREYLCVQIENLSESENDNPENSARQIRQAQATWKNLGSQGHSQELWERFNQACQTAYEPCKIHFSHKAREREQHLSDKQTLCERLEAFAQETDWENTTNWKEVYNFVRDAENIWRNIGATDRKYKKTTQRSYQAAMLVLETHLDDERKRNCSSRLHLIGQVDEVASSLKEAIECQNDAAAKGDATAKQVVEDKINAAIKEVKELQNQWQVTVPGNRRIEREFWGTFRSACDVVFDYRKQQQEAQKKEIQAYLKSKISLCKQAEDLATLEGDAIKTARAQLKKLKEEWKNIKKEDRTNIGSNLRKKAKATEAVEERFKKACRLAEMRYQAQRSVERREQIDLIKQKAVFCIELEQADTLARQEVQEDPDWLSTVQSAWAQLPQLEYTDWDDAIEQRFQKACAAASTGEQSFSKKTVSNKETLCVRMEILAGVESPPEAAKARLAYQVERLSAAMSGKKIESPEQKIEAQEIEQSWYLSGAVPAEQTQRLEQRFSKACEAFYS